MGSQSSSASAFLRRTVGAVSQLDRRALKAVVERRAPGFDALFVPAAYTGAGGLPWIGLVLLLRVRAHGGSRLNVPRASAGVLAGWAAAQLVKRLNDRARPCHGNGGVALVECPDGPSLPSDQAAAAFAGAAAISAALPEWTSAMYAAAALTAFSRVYVGVHYPSDVAAGALIGRLFGRALAARSR